MSSYYLFVYTFYDKILLLNKLYSIIIIKGVFYLDNNEYGIHQINADIFMRAFMMPETIFKKDVIENTVDGKCDVNALAKLYQVEISDVIARGRELGLWQ